MVFRNAATEALAQGRPCPFCGAVAVDTETGAPVDVFDLPAGSVTDVVMEHEAFCPAVRS